MQRASFLVPLASALVWSALVAAPRAQSLYAVEGVGPFVHELTGPPGGPCAWPNGPNLRTFGTAGNGFCPGLIVFPLPLDGGVAVSSLTDLVYASDGFVIARFASNGAFVDSFFPPFFVTGMALDPFGPLLWITDGVTYGAVTPPPVHGCLGGVPPFVLGPWPLPFGPGFFNGAVTDLDWETATATLIGCDVAGNVVSFLPGPAAVPGPYGSFPVAGVGCPLLTPTLTGIAFDDTVPGTGTFYVTDGFEIAYLVPGGGAAVPTFYTPAACFPVATPGVSGLAFAGRAVPYGAGVDTTGLPAPRIGSIGQSFTPNPGFGVTLGGSVPGSLAFLFRSRNDLCPPFVFAGLTVLIDPATFALVATAPVDAGGNAFVNVPLFGPPGRRFTFQWLAVTPVPSDQVSDALSLTTTVP